MRCFQFPLWVKLTLGGLLLSGPQTALACATCFGQSDSRLAAGMNAGIFTLLGVVGLVLVGSAYFFIKVLRNSSRTTPPPQNRAGSPTAT